MPVELITEKYEVLSQDVAELVAAQLKAKPDSCFGLPTGGSPKGCYKLLAELSRAGKLDWSKAKCFALDDYLGANEKDSFQTFLQTHLYQYINVKSEHCFNPRDFDDYDQVIEEHGGLDLTMLGLGANGHIAFNEPGTPLESFTHCIWLTESTKRANSGAFGSASSVPPRAITMGIRTILNSKKLVLMACGETKRSALKSAFEDAVSPDLPASYLNLHADKCVFKDFD